MHEALHHDPHHHQADDQRCHHDCVSSDYTDCTIVAPSCDQVVLKGAAQVATVITLDPRKQKIGRVPRKKILPLQLRKSCSYRLGFLGQQGWQMRNDKYLKSSVNLQLIIVLLCQKDERRIKKRPGARNDQPGVQQMLSQDLNLLIRSP